MAATPPPSTAPTPSPADPATPSAAPTPPATAITPPLAPRRPHQLEAHGRTRIDDWYWLRDRDDPEVIAYLEAENSYAEAVLAPTRSLQEVLFEQIKGRVQETDAGPPARDGGWWYYTRTEEGRQYPVHCRRPDTGQSAALVTSETRAGTPSDEEVLLDENELSDGDYLAVGVFDVSPRHDLLAYAVDLDGSEEYTLRFRRIGPGSDGELGDVIEGVYYGSAWASDGKAFFYVRPDEAMRPHQVWRHELGRPTAEDRLIFQEDDERFYAYVGLSRAGHRVIVGADSKTSSEVHWLDAAGPADQPLRLIRAREPGVEYQAEPDGEDWLLLTNGPGAGTGPATNFELRRLRGDGSIEVVLPHRPEVKLEAVDAFAGFIAVVERSSTDGLERVRIIDRSGAPHVVEQPEAAYTLTGGSNPEWEQTTYRFGYTSLVTPRTSVDYHVAERRREPIWTQIVPGYEADRYITERLWAEAPDGVKVPVTLVARADTPRDGTAPGLLYGYGSYEMSTDPMFSVVQLNLVERGAIFAIAHIRGGGELGRSWYEQGRMEHKVNTFTDFIAAAEALIDGGWVDANRLAARGGSAGGLLMGAVTNMRPDLWRAIIAEVPFVDVVTTMSDTSLPLTVTEWEEWGDPVHDEAAFDRMLSYSPYDNVVARPQWPAIYASAGLNDPRVGFWEPAKWVAKLRAVGAGTPDRPVLLKTEMGAGHGGPSGRYDSWRDEARVQAFLLGQLGIE
ncbi:MAG TPA: S9 family peptidase [Acidimicrobiales bacterium]|nr:S9 family peptidase [Acidimicrobiales bacterium]